MQQKKRKLSKLSKKTRKPLQKKASSKKTKTKAKRRVSPKKTSVKKKRVASKRKVSVMSWKWMLVKKPRTKKKKTPRKNKRFFQKLLTFLGILLITISLAYKANSFFVDNFLFANSKPNACIENKSLLSKISIPELAITLPVEQSTIKDGIWQISKTGVSHLADSSLPNTQETTILYGHNTEHQLANLINVKKGQYIVLKSRDGSLHSYVVSDIKTVLPTDIGVLNSMGRPSLVLYTCTGFADSLRLVVRAHPANNKSIIASTR